MLQAVAVAQRDDADLAAILDGGVGGVASAAVAVAQCCGTCGRTQEARPRKKGPAQRARQVATRARGRGARPS